MVIVVVSPANAVVLVVPSCNKAVSPSRAVPAVVPKPGNDVLALLVVISDACCVVIPTFAVFAVTSLFAETRASV